MRSFRFAVLTATILALVPVCAFAAAKHTVRRPVARVSADSGITVPMDEARIVTFSQPVTTVFVGNTYVADVTIIDSRHAYVLGKTFGATNVIGLDADRRQIVNSQINVTNRMVGSVTLNRGPESYNYSCTNAHCEAVPRPGDPQVWFNNTEIPAQTHESNAKGWASGATTQQ